MGASKSKALAEQAVRNGKVAADISQVAMKHAFQAVTMAQSAEKATTAAVSSRADSPSASLPAIEPIEPSTTAQTDQSSNVAVSGMHEILKESQAASVKVNPELDEDILAEIRKWGTLSANLVEIPVTKEKSASMVRYHKEKELEDAGSVEDGVMVERIPGRLSEFEIQELYTKLRDNGESFTDEMINKEYLVPIEMIPILKSMYRAATIRQDEDIPALSHAK